jgi:hypothetical protein
VHFDGRQGTVDNKVATAAKQVFSWEHNLDVAHKARECASTGTRTCALVTIDSRLLHTTGGWRLP